MIKHIVKRILIAIPVLICVILVIFVMLRILPGNPAETMAGEHVSQAVIDKISREMGLDEPFIFSFLNIWQMLSGGISVPPTV